MRPARVVGAAAFATTTIGKESSNLSSITNGRWGRQTAYKRKAETDGANWSTSPGGEVIFYSSCVIKLMMSLTTNVN